VTQSSVTLERFGTVSASAICQGHRTRVSSGVRYESRPFQSALLYFCLTDWACGSVELRGAASPLPQPRSPPGRNWDQRGQTLPSLFTAYGATVVQVPPRTLDRPGVPAGQEPGALSYPGSERLRDTAVILGGAGQPLNSASRTRPRLPREAGVTGLAAVEDVAVSRRRRPGRGGEPATTGRALATQDTSPVAPAGVGSKLVGYFPTRRPIRGPLRRSGCGSR
jgi:hypothetical protein